MSDIIKVEGHAHLVRDVNSNAIINTNQNEYQLYMKRIKVREKQSDELRSAVKEINNIKNERMKEDGHLNLIRDNRSNAIVNTSVTEYQVYMKRIKAREEHGDQIRNAVKEINTLKAELREIKGLIKELVNGS